MSEEEQQQEELLLKDLEGISSPTIKKLKEVGILTLKDLSVQTPNQLAQVANVSKETAEKYIAQSLAKQGPMFITGTEELENRQRIQRLTTGSNALDTLLGNGQGQIGLETGAVTEFYGQFGSGKSQICHTLCVTAQLPVSEHGLDTNVIYIDTEGTFRIERITQIAKARGMDVDKVLSRIQKARAFNVSHLELITDDIFKYIRDFHSKLVIVDSIIALHRAEGSDRGQLAARQQSLNAILHKLLKVAEMNDVIVVIINQVVAKPDQFSFTELATGGNVVAHKSTYRIHLRKSGNNRIARIIDSPYHAQEETRFTVTDRGIDDIEEDKK